MKTQDFCPLCDNPKIIQDSKHDEWICSNNHCMFHDIEKIRAVNEICFKINTAFARHLSFDEVVFMARPKCTDPFFVEAYIVHENVADSVLNPKT